MEKELIRADDQDYFVVQNLVSFYVYDMAAIVGWPCPESGRFGGCDELPEYWQTQNPRTSPLARWEPGDRGHPFLIRVDGHLGGFALIREFAAGGEVDFDMGQFFVLRTYRGKGTGRWAARRLFDRFPGRWQVRQLFDNEPARAFWLRVIADYTRGRYSGPSPPRDFGEAKWAREVALSFDNSTWAPGEKEEGVR